MSLAGDRPTNMAEALANARRAGRMTPDSTALVVNQALARGDQTMALRLILQARDDIRDGLAPAIGPDATLPTWVAAWHGRSRRIRAKRYDTLLCAIVEHEFADAAPAWAMGACLKRDWVLPDPFHDPQTVRACTPHWLAQARIFIAERALSTA